MGVYYAQMLTRHGFGEDVQAVIEGWKQGMKTATEAVSTRMLDAISIIGTPKEVVAKLDQWATLGVDEPLLTLPAGPVDNAGSQLSALMDALKA
jgi:alkanesulfonate monooxygenase SsuD/methylene tetrahydromethanopterin reductase-like flavin-dependent oxidoreductase (luciferase family)